MVDVHLGHLLADLKLPRQPEGAHPVDDAEVDGLGLAPQLGSDPGRFDLKHLGGRAGVDVFLVPEGPNEGLVGGAVRQNAQLDL